MRDLSRATDKEFKDDKYNTDAQFHTKVWTLKLKQTANLGADIAQ